MYIAGASVNYEAMMKYATDRIYRIADAVALIMPEVFHGEIACFYVPLSRSLTLLFDQGLRPQMLAMRQAMAQLLDYCLIYVFLNPGFRAQFSPIWLAEIWKNCVHDNLYFSKAGLLRPVPNRESRQSRISMIMSSFSLNTPEMMVEQQEQEENYSA